jgi:hypothetical protein
MDMESKLIYSQGKYRKDYGIKIDFLEVLKNFEYYLKKLFGISINKEQNILQYF